MKKENIIIHRVNNIELLKSIDYKFGCEVDIRTNGSKLILNHDPFKSGENLIDYLDEYRHGTLVLNIKETGIENVYRKSWKEISILFSFRWQIYTKSV